MNIAENPEVGPREQAGRGAGGSGDARPRSAWPLLGALLAAAGAPAAIVSLCLGALGCGAASQTLVPPGGFALALGRTHPLVGQIYSSARGQLVSEATLLTALKRASFVVIGETHDNPDHHRLQAQLLQRYGRTHQALRVAFEMLDEDDRAALQAHFDSPEALARAVDWADSGWPDFPLYRPVFAEALRQGAQIVAASPSAEHVRQSMQGVDAATASELKLEPPLPATVQQALRKEISASHCGYAPQKMVTMMQNAQTYKDAFMARAVVQAGAPGVLIAGRGHAIKQRAVPLFVRRRQALPMLSIGLIDVDDTRTHPRDYDVASFDFAVFTPRVSDEDPCERFRRELQHMHPSK